MRSRWLALLLLAAPCVCHAQTTDGQIVALPDGSAAYKVDCDGWDQDIQICYREASQICLEIGTWTIVEHRLHAGPFNAIMCGLCDDSICAWVC